MNTNAKLCAHGNDVTEWCGECWAKGDCDADAKLAAVAVAQERRTLLDMEWRECMNTIFSGNGSEAYWKAVERSQEIERLIAEDEKR